MMTSRGISQPSPTKARAALTLLLVVTAVLTVVAAGCGSDKPAVSHEGGKTIHDYCDKSDAVAKAVVKELETAGVVDPGIQPRPGVQRNIRPSGKGDVYMRWTVATYDAPQWSGTLDLLTYVVSRAAGKAGATVASQAEAPSAVIYTISFSDRSLKGLTDSLETVRLVVPFESGNALVGSSGSQTTLPTSVASASSMTEIAPRVVYQDMVGGDQPSEPEKHVPKEAPLPGAESGSAARAGARLAIVIDDLGNGAAGTEQLFQIDAPLTVAVLPEGSRATAEATRAGRHGFAVLLHQPMEPHDPAKRPGRGAIMVGMGEDEIKEVLSANLAIVPNAMGVNNHMGSKVTEDRDAMSAIMYELFSRGLFFFDSRTTPDSAAPQVARDMGAPLIENARFLDHIADEDYVVDQIRAAARLAMSRGTAAVIGHVRPATMRALARMIPELAAAGVQLVRLDELMPSDWKTTLARLRKPTSEPAVASPVEPAPQPAAHPAAESAAAESSAPPAGPPAGPSAGPPAEPPAGPPAQPSVQPQLPEEPPAPQPSEPVPAAQPAPDVEQDHSHETRVEAAPEPTDTPPAVDAPSPSEPEANTALGDGAI